MTVSGRFASSPPVVLVHGNPETTAVWEPLVAALCRAGSQARRRSRDDVLCLSPPGFGAPVPDGFSPTMDGYRDWLVAELEAIGVPVDLVGHDWGGGHVLNVAMTRPDLLRTWASDILGGLHPGYVWHDLAQVWQKPGAGEEALAGVLAAGPEARAARFASFGVSHEVGRRMAAAFDAEMGRCILALYRSAAQPAMAEAGVNLPAAAARPGLAILATEDHFVGTEAMHRESAAAAGARVAVLEGLGHWWMVQDPARSAEALERFWASPSG